MNDKKRSRNKIKKIWNAVTTVIVVLAVLLAVAVVGGYLFGVKPYVVLSGSMEPVYPTGSLLYVRNVDVEELEVGDSITFLLDEDKIATHRIIEIIPDEDDPDVIRFRTQGDANDVPDATPVHCKNVLGKPLFAVPYLGYAVSAVRGLFRTPPYSYFTIAGCAVLIVLMFLPDLLGGSDKKSDKKRKDKNQKGENRSTNNDPDDGETPAAVDGNDTPTAQATDDSGAATSVSPTCDPKGTQSADKGDSGETA